ncbi:MAG: DUF5107 domain-containing protein, partial [Victivallales bacterium]|nr:DUF5107 domain-containing protein [Victivallales bacterium]
MTELRFDIMNIHGHRLGKASWFPAIRELIKTEISAELDEDDGLFIGYGMMSDGLPYTLQDVYDTPEEDVQFKSVILENRYLKAVFLPELGGRLWSLFDKENQRDVILENTAFLPCNLAIRNAWVAGGVEFNCGRRGHDAQTCSPRFTAVVHHESFPVLRFYEYQRDRGTPFQYDCFLPDDSRFLFIRGRIWNPNRCVVPMYWWSNTALPEIKGSRIVTPAWSAFANWYSNGSHALAKITLPEGEGFDGTYPTNFQYVKDHFYNIHETQRPYECVFYPEGYGFCHVSTRRLHGRKLFVWGQSQGGRHWNRKLLGPGLDSYLEVQAGLAHSQQECLPMPPRTAWEWLEGYGAITMQPEDVFGTWNKAVETVGEKIDAIMPEEQLEALLRQTHDEIALKKGELVYMGSGWGALEEARTGEKLCPQLDFCNLGEEQAPWMELLQSRRMSATQPVSYQVSDQWFEHLKNAVPSEQVHYQLALNYYRRGDWERAENELSMTGEKQGKPHLLHVMANLRFQQKRFAEAAELI